MARRRRDERRPPGTGYATQAPNGTFTAHFPKIPTGYHVKRGFDTRARAEAWLDQLATQRDQKIDYGGGRQKVGRWMDAWKARALREREWKAKTVADVDWKLGYTLPYLQDMLLADVMPDHIDTMLDTLGRDLAPSTIRQIRNYLWQVFEDARERRYITFNPVIKPSRRKRPKQKAPIRLTPPQAAALLEQAAPSFYAAAWWLILVLGLRAGEVCGLRWADVDLEAAVLHILQEVTDVRGKATKDNPKNDKQRHLPIPRALVTLLRTHRAAYLKRAAAGLKRGTWEEHGLLFPGRSGKPMNPVALRHQLSTLTAAGNLPDVTTHMLRHTAGKFYTDLGTEHAMTKAILGHSPDITGHYAPPDPEAMRPHVERVHALLTHAAEQRKRAGEA